MGRKAKTKRGARRPQLSAAESILKRCDAAQAQLRDRLDNIMGDVFPSSASNELFHNMVSYVLGPNFSFPKHTALPSGEQDMTKKPRNTGDALHKSKETFSGKRKPERKPSSRLTDTNGIDTTKTSHSSISPREDTSSFAGPVKRKKISPVNHGIQADDLKNTSGENENSSGHDENHALTNLKSQKTTLGPSSDNDDLNGDEDKENQYAVGKDGHISEAVINRFKGKPSGNAGVPSTGITGSVPKSNRLFSGQPKANRLKSVAGECLTGVEKQKSTRLASKTPGMKKLDFNIGKPPAVPAPKSLNRGIAASLFPSNDNKVVDSQQDLDMKDPEQQLGESTEAGPEIRTSTEVMEEDDANRTNNLNSDSERHAGNATDVEREVAERTEDTVPEKKSHTLEPLFPPGLFDVANPPRSKSTKSISFAPEVESIEKGANTKKRQGSELSNAASSNKRQRSADKPPKSELRERIESMRLRFSTKTDSTPQTASSKIDAETSKQGPENETKQIDRNQGIAPKLGSLTFENRQGRKSSDIESDTGDLDEEFLDANDFEKSSQGERFSSNYSQRSPSSAHSPAVQTPTAALESKFDAASPDETSVKKSRSTPDTDVVMTDEATRNNAGDTPGPSTSGGPGMLSNIYTSVKSLLPNSSAMFGFQAESESQSYSKGEGAMSVAERQRIDTERREAELQARREAAQAARQLQQREKQKKVEENRRLQAEEKARREEELKRKETIRLARLREELEQRKKKKAEEDKKRELRRQRVKEHREKVAAAEEAKRLEVERRAQAARAAASKPRVKAKAGPSGAVKPGASKGVQTGGPSGLSGTPALERKKSVEVTSYEMSAERVRGADDDDDSDSERMAKRKGKKIPTWAQKENVLKAMEKQTGDPDNHFSRVQSVNLEDVFASTQQHKKRYRTRNSSGQWTKDRLTAKEEMEYKKKAGFI